MSRTILVLCLLTCSWNLPASGDIPGGRSPDKNFEVVNVGVNITSDGGYPDRQTHFELHDKSGKSVLSELDFDDLNPASPTSSILNLFRGANTVLWRQNSRFVAVSIDTSKFAVKTIVFYRDGDTFKRVAIPEYEPFDDEHASYGSSDSTHREPLHWHRNGDLVLDITMGYHTKSEGHTPGYFATVHFTGNPPKAIKGSQTKVVNRD